MQHREQALEGKITPHTGNLLITLDFNTRINFCRFLVCFWREIITDYSIREIDTPRTSLKGAARHTFLANFTVSTSASISKEVVNIQIESANGFTPDLLYLRDSEDHMLNAPTDHLKLYASSLSD